MNQVIETILNHRSVRSYEVTPLSDAVITQLALCAQKAPSSNNDQSVSIIVITDKEKKELLAHLCGNQPYIAEAGAFFVFCIDFNRAKIAAEKHNRECLITDDFNATIIGTFDCGLAMQNMIIAAESLELGTVPIGGILNNPKDVIALLDLPAYVFPVCGLVVGVPKDSSQPKPRLPLPAVLHKETYDRNQRAYIDAYDETMADYMLKRTNGQSSRNWSESISRVYQNKSTRDTKAAMAAQKLYNL